MSNLLKSELYAECQNKPCSAVEELITPREKDLGGFSVRRLFPTTGRKSVGPWVFFDHMGPAQFNAGNGVNVRPHPHIGIATVTYVFEGEILHRDSLGSYQTITPGDVNLMIAGKGIVHSERERPEVTNKDHVLNGLQLWMALPEADEEAMPEFHHYSKDKLPTALISDIPVRVLIGTAYGLTSKVKTFSETLYVEATLQPDQVLDSPQAQECAVYVAKGEIEIDGASVPEYSMAILNTSVPSSIQALKHSRIVFIGGDNLGQRYIEWNFVSSSKSRIAQAKQDWKNGRFPLVPGDEEEFIPLP
ncbi:pirin family protein [Kangiella sediminilitoris]|uniref:Pirin domain protein n=1 Tax=Kangiella sediminilitoris TaxID=1144748 RepID=A0A1B3BAM2_9GAMM|nr:pirin family protein [Kangiella sediminilitoris]AOE49840.1 Pirin domain protein [Kangiella sediminilitoris]